MKLQLSSHQIDSLALTSTLLSRGYMTHKAVHSRMVNDHPDVLELLIENPKEMCHMYPQFFDVFNAVLEQEDWLKWEMIK